MQTGAELNQFEAQALRNYPFLVVTVTTLAVVVSDRDPVANIAQWDWFWISGVLVFLVAYPLSLRVPGVVDTSLRQLVGAGRLHPPERLTSFLAGLHRAANRWAYWAALVLAALVFAAWIVVILRWKPREAGGVFADNVSGMVIETFCAGLAGRFVGRTFCYSGAGSRLRRAGMWLAPADSDAGTDLVRWLSAFWTGLVDLLILLTVYLATWLLVISADGPTGRYAEWRYPYVFFVSGFLSLVILIGARALTAVRAAAGPGNGSRLVIALLTSRPVCSRLLVVALLVAALSFPT